MRGTYRFYQDGALVAAAPNLITAEGRKSIFRYLAGQQTQFARAIAVGAGETAPTINDRHLTLEFDRANVSVSSPNYNTSSIIFKGTLSGVSVGRIYEVGLFELTSTNNPTTTILSFDTSLESWTAGTADAEHSRLGPTNLRLDAATNGSVTSVLSPFTVSLVDYSLTDVFTLSLYTLDANTSSLTVRFRDEAGTSYFQFSPTVTPGFNTLKFTKNDLTKTGTLTWADVTNIEVRVNAKATDTALDPEIYPGGLGYTGTRVHLDSLTVIGGQFDNSNTLISRSVLGGFVQKRQGRPVDVEYTLELNV